MPLSNLAMLTVHASPLAKPGGEKIGGMNVYIRELSQELGRMGIAVDVFTRRTDVDSSEVDTSLGENVKVIHVPAGPPEYIDPNKLFGYLPDFTAGVSAYKGINQKHYAVVFSHYWLSGWVAQRLKDMCGIPFAQMFHTLGHMKNRIAPGYYPTLLPDLRVMTETQIMKWADRVVAATPAEQAQLLWLYRADRRKITVIPPGVNDDQFYPVSMAKAKDNLGLPQTTNHLLFVGRIEPLKAVDTILLAIQHLSQSEPATLKNFQFSIVGGDPNNTNDSEMQRLKKLVSELEIEAFVEFLGSKDQTALRNYYAASVAVVMPSDYESFGMVALEAMACGTPVIASEVGGLAYLIKNDETGFLIPARDAQALADRISQLIRQPQLRKKMGQTASRLAHNYDWSSIAAQVVPMLEQISTRSAQAISHRRR